MTTEREASRGIDRPTSERGCRSWTQRYIGPVRYCRYSATDAGNHPSIIFKFALADGQELPQEVYDVLHGMKQINRREKDGGGIEKAGLEFKRDKVHGRVWKLPDTPTGRFVADAIDSKLEAVAVILESMPDRGR